MWKYWIVLYQLSLTMELLICPFFWIFLFKIADAQPRFQHGLLWLGLRVDHSFPLICLLIDYCHNQIPFILRHISILCAVLLLYGALNIIITKTVEPIYPPLSWDSVGSVMMGIVAFAAEVLIFLILHLTNKYKIRRI